MFKKLFQKKYIGKTVLVGISVFSNNGELVEKFQYFGKIISIGDVISIKTDEGNVQSIPPVLSSLKRAEKGVYTLKSNGKQIDNPDFVSSWNITKPQ
jgi:hypothetical protein